MLFAWRYKRLTNSEGFSLAEAAIALVVVATVVGAMVPSVLSMRAGEQARATRQNLETVMRASAAYVQANGCFPCPTPSALLVEDEQGSFGLVRGDISGAACGDCQQQIGVVPFRSLGLPQSLARDGYGRYLTFAVDAVLTSANFGSSMCKEAKDECTQEDVDLHKLKKGLCKENISTSTHVNIKQVSINPTASVKVALLVLSHGKNGYGAYRERPAATQRLPFPVSVPTCSLADNTGLERCNSDDGKLDFIETTPATGNDPFDDQLLYFSRDALMTFAGGRACDTKWAGP
jgi:type II secretory pathway pseudopilin PulG